MIDYLKIHNLPVIPEKLLNNGLLTFPLSNVATTGEVLDRWQVAHFNTLTFKIKGNNSKLFGSPHKYRQGGENWQDYNLFDIQDTIHELAETFEFDPEMAVINFIEIGVNIRLDNDPDQIINCLVIHGKERFKELPTERNTKGNGRISEKDQFTIKVYNKSLQNSLPFHLLRFEIKVKRMKFLERYGINGLTLADLTRPDVYPKFKTMLLDLLSGIVIYNPDIEPDNLTTLQDRELLNLGQFAEYWQRLDRRRRNEKLIRFKELAGTNAIIENLKCKISDKWERLTNPDKITSLENEIESDKITTLRNKQYRPENDQTGQINTTIKGEFVHRCKVTGIDISMQRQGSQFLCDSGIRFLFENDPETFAKLKTERLSQKWQNEQIEVQFREIAHSIRNEFNNPRHNATRDIKNLYSYPVLFDFVSFIRPDKIRMAGLCT